MVFEGKELKDIKTDDIQFLIDNQIVEDISIEYKSRMWDPNDEGTREMLRDISSMANARGGHFILGMEEDEKNDGLPKEIVGISSADKAIQRIMNVCLSCIDGKIIGLDAISIPLKDDKHVVVIRVPRSTRIPHMITFKSLYQCWRRHGKQKNIMSIDEIREACLKVENLRKDLEGFIAERKEKVVERAQDRPLYLISATPMIVKDDIIDVFDSGLMKLLQNPPSTRGERGANVDCCNSFGRGWKPTLYGIKAEIQDSKSMEVLRNGHVEFVAFLSLFEGDKFVEDETEYWVLKDWEVAEYLVNFMLFLKKFLSYSSISEPMVISVALINNKNIGMYEYGIPEWLRPGKSPSIWKEESHLVLPAMQINSIDNPHKVAKIFADRIWNAFGFKNAYFFDEKGNFTLEK